MKAALHRFSRGGLHVGRRRKTDSFYMHRPVARSRKKIHRWGSIVYTKVVVESRLRDSTSLDPIGVLESRIWGGLIFGSSQGSG